MLLRKILFSILVIALAIVQPTNGEEDDSTNWDAICAGFVAPGAASPTRTAASEQNACEGGEVAGACVTTSVINQGDKETTTGGQGEER